MSQPESRLPRIALVGQPNCGKSTLFNAVAGYRTIASNFPGTTVNVFSSQVRAGGKVFELIDLPGTYSLSGCEPAEKNTRDYLLQKKADLVINVIDASMLGRSLDLTLELMELGIPMVICLNMLDEAKRKGVEIDTQLLSRILGLPVIGAIATKGEGIDQLFQTSLKMISSPQAYHAPHFSRDVEDVAENLRQSLECLQPEPALAQRFFLLKLLEGDPDAMEQLKKIAPGKLDELLQLQKILAESHQRSPAEVICSERHALALNLFEKATKVKPALPRTWQEKMDYWLMHKYLGYLFLAIILFLLFATVFWAGKLLEAPLLSLFAQIEKISTQKLGTGLLGTLSAGLIQGIAGGVGIVLPYLVPFLFGLSMLEDLGYLPRAAFLMDAFMHRIGLHGKAVIPLVLGYGCSVPAVMSVQTLENPRDRFVTGILTPMIPCAARTTVIFALVGFLLGPAWALLMYVLNLLVVAGIGKILTSFRRDPSEGLIMEVPSYKLPGLKPLWKKVWFRLREFIIVAWPILIIGSIILSLLDFFHLGAFINRALSPLVVHLLGLPEQVGITLIFGVMRKEMSVVMLAQALGTTDFASVMTSTQVVVFTVFVIFYVPCVATLAVLWKILRWKGTLASILLTLGIATLMGIIFRFALGWLN